MTRYPVLMMQGLSPLTTRLIALVLVAAGFAARLYSLASESLWYDELLQLDIAQSPLLSIFPRLRGHAAVPLDYLIGHFWILLGRQDGWVRLPAVLLGTLTLPVAYHLGRRMLGRSEGLLLVALLAFAPFHVRYSQEVRPYALVVLGVTLTGFAFWRLRETGRWRYFIALQIGVLIFSLAHFFGLAIFGPLLLVAASDLLLPQSRKRGVILLGGLLATLVLPLVILFVSGWGNLYYTAKDFGQALVEPERFNVEAEQKPDQGSGPPLNRLFIKNEVVAPLVGSGANVSLQFFNVLAGMGLLYLLTQKKYKVSLFLGLWLILPVISILAFLIFRGAFFASRYIIAILPAYLLLLATGILALPRWLKCAEPRWLSLGAFVVLSGLVFLDMGGDLGRLYQNRTKENWHLVGEFIAQNAGPDDAVIAMRAEPTMNWYYPPAWTAPNYFWDLDVIRETALQARRSWVILSIFSSTVDDEVEAWLSEQQAVRFDLDPDITVYYFGAGATREQLLEEVQRFVLPVDHAIYAYLGRENRRNPAVARRYFELAIEYAPDDEARAEYQTAMNDLAQN